MKGDSLASWLSVKRLTSEADRVVELAARVGKGDRVVPPLVHTLSTRW